MKQFLKVFIVSFIGVLLVGQSTYAQKPSFAKEWVKKGWEYERIGDYEKALEAFSKAIEFDPNNAEAYIGLAYVGPTPKAMENINKAIELAPNNSQILSDAYSILSTLSILQSQLNKAEEYANKSIELAPNNPRAYVARGVFYSTTGNFLSAELDFSKACRMGYWRACRLLEIIRK